jgi:glycolate oxidase FAD binding subunit
VDLKDLLGDVGARPPTPDDPRIDGLSPSLVLEPDDDEACAEALSLCHQENMAVVPVGGATRLELGNAPSRLDAFLMTTRLTGVEDHIPGDLTVAVRAGTTLEALNQQLARANQFLPLDAPHPGRATLGGILALGEPGLRRRPGARPRDLVLGLEGVLADGSRFKSGGRVVKNVAGYELIKLFVGSVGTLAVVTRVFLRLRALPEDTRSVALGFKRASAAERAWRELRELAHAPEVAVLLNPIAAEMLGLQTWTLLLRFEGLGEEVSGGVAACGGDALADAPWERIRDFPAGPHEKAELGLRGQVTPARTFDLAQSWQDGGALVAYPDAGLVYSRTMDPDALGDRQERAAAQGGVVVIERAPTALKNELDVFGETPGGFELMRQIKAKLDPTGILSPGRFVGRI